MSKNLSDLSNDELMKIAKIPVKEDNNKDLPPAQRFIVSEAIKGGDYRVQTILVYHRYVLWCEKYNQVILSKPKFYREFEIYFKKFRAPDGNAWCYALDREGFAVTELHKITPRTRKSKSDNKEATPNQGPKKRKTRVPKPTVRTED